MQKLKSVFFIVSFFSLFHSEAQDSTLVGSLIHQVKESIVFYNELSPFGVELFALEKLELTEKELNDLNELNEDLLDSIDVLTLQWVYQSRIENALSQLVVHPDFLKRDIYKTLNDYIDVVVSDDHKMYNFSFPENTGGSYKSDISIMFYTDLNKIQIMNQNKIEDEFNPYFIFNVDGYYNIDTINTKEGVKYFLQGGVQSCSMCYTNYVSLVKFDGFKFIEEFSFSTFLRDFDTEIFYDPLTRTLNAVYATDDLTQTCSCKTSSNNELDDEKATDFVESETICSCFFVFNGKTFIQSVKE